MLHRRSGVISAKPGWPTKTKIFITWSLQKRFANPQPKQFPPPPPFFLVVKPRHLSYRILHFLGPLLEASRGPLAAICHQASVSRIALGPLLSQSPTGRRPSWEAQGCSKDEPYRVSIGKDGGEGMVTRWETKDYFNLPKWASPAKFWSLSHLPLLALTSQVPPTPPRHRFSLFHHPTQFT